MVRAERMLKWKGIMGYGQLVQEVISAKPSEKIFFTRNKVAARWMLLMTRRPSPTIWGMAEKSESSSTSCPTWVAAWAPEAMAMPQSASFMASTSLTPSPVMATVCFRFLKARISFFFLSGVTRPKTV